MCTEKTLQYIDGYSHYDNQTEGNILGIFQMSRADNYPNYSKLLEMGAIPGDFLQVGRSAGCDQRAFDVTDGAWYRFERWTSLVRSLPLN